MKHAANVWKIRLGTFLGCLFLGCLLIIHFYIFWIPLSISIATKKEPRELRRSHVLLLVSTLLLIGALNFGLSFRLVGLIKPAHPVIDSLFVTIVTGVLGVMLPRWFAILSRKKRCGVT
jgi:hypothetical protein